MQSRQNPKSIQHLLRHPAIHERPPAVTDQASDLTPALQEANKAHNKQHKNIKQIYYWGHSVKLLFIGSKGD
jgi:hypothetical protein